MRWLFLLRHPPRTGLRAAETLDRLLTFAAFDQAVSLLFLDDGVYQLSAGQQDAAGAPVLSDLLGALAFYGVETVWVESESLAERGLALADLAIPVAPLARSAIAALIATHDRVLSA